MHEYTFNSRNSQAVLGIFQSILHNSYKMDIGFTNGLDEISSISYEVGSDDFHKINNKKDLLFLVEGYLKQNDKAKIEMNSHGIQSRTTVNYQAISNSIKGVLSMREEGIKLGGTSDEHYQQQLKFARQQIEDSE